MAGVAGSGMRMMILMGLMMGGARAVDAITANMMPITAKLFTDNLTLIGVMLAINRISGFLVQPYAAWKSDRHAGAGGRRRPFLLIAWPATLVCVGLLGALPFIVPGEYRSTAAVVGLFFVINLAMQVALDVCYGNGTPMYGDTFPSGMLGRANAIRSILGSLVMVGMMSVGLPLADRLEFLPFLIAMGFLAISWAVSRFGIQEIIPAKLPPRGHYHPFLPLGELRSPQTRNVAAIASAAMVALAVTEMFHALFVIETLDLSISALGWSATAGLIVSFICPYPVGLIVDRFGPRKVLIVGFLLMIAVELAFIFWVSDLASLTFALILYRGARVVIQIPILPLMFHNTPFERRGSIFAGVQMTRAALASAATIAAAYLVNLSGSYRVCYIIAGLACIVGIVQALRFKPAKTPSGLETTPA